MKRLLSIIVPIYNGECYIDSLVSTIKKQKEDLDKFLNVSGCIGTAMELLLVDDGSKDNTLKLCRQQEQQYEWIRVIHTENYGVSHARNTGLEAANGEWIQFLDVDDTLGEGMLKEFASNSISSENNLPDIIICGCHRISHNAEAVSCGPKENVFLQRQEVVRLLDQMKMDDRYWILDYCWNKWYKKEILETYKLRFEESLSLGEDFVFNTRYIRYVQKAVLLSTCYYQYLVGETGLVSRFQPEPWVSRQILFDAQKDLYQCKGLWDNNQKLIELHYGQIIFGDIRTIYSKRCGLSYKEKKNYMNHMIKSSLYDMMLLYLKGKKTLAFQLYYYICKTKQSALILIMIYLESMLRK